MKLICFYHFPVEMKEFLFKIVNGIKGNEPIMALWVDPELEKIKIKDLLEMPLPQENLEKLMGYEIEEKRRAVIYLAGFAREEISPIVKFFKGLIPKEQFDLIFSAQTETNVKWTFNRLWQDVVEDHDYFKELEQAHKEGRPFTLIPDDDKPTSL